MLFIIIIYNLHMKFLKTDTPYIEKNKWKKLFLTTSILTIGLYIAAMIASLCGSNYFILQFQNTQLDKIEEWFRNRGLFAFISWAFSTLEFAVVTSFIIKRFPKWYYVVAFYIPMAILATFLYIPNIVFTLYPFIFYISIPIIEQLKDNYQSDYKIKFSFKKYLFYILRLAIAVAITYVLQVAIYVIKEGEWSFTNNIMSLSTHFIYAMEYNIALSVILFTILLLYKEKGDSNLWAKHLTHGGSSQTSMKHSQKSLRWKNLTKTQKNKIVILYVKLYLTQICGFLLLMVLPFLLGKVIEFLVMYLSFAIARYILGFKYSLHYNKETTCITVGVIVFGILSLAVPFFYIILIIAILYGVALAILLHLSYKYKGMWLFTQVAKHDKFALLYTFFDGDLSHEHVRKFCIYKGLDEFQTQLICEFTEGNKISYIAWKHNYSQRMTIYKLDEAIDLLLS